MFSPGYQAALDHLFAVEDALETAEQDLRAATQRVRDLTTKYNRAKLDKDLAFLRSVPCEYEGCGAEVDEPCNIENDPGHEWTHSIRNPHRKLERQRQ